MKIILYGVGGLIALIVLISAFSDPYPDNSPSVSWSSFPPYVKIGIDNSVKERSCSGLQKAFDAAARKGGKYTDVMDYIDWQLNNLYCYGTKR